MDIKWTNTIKFFNNMFKTNYKNYNGSFNGFKYIVYKLDNTLIYYNKINKSYTLNRGVK